MIDFVRSNLCVHDPRSDVYSTFNVSDDVVPPRNGCCCDRCFYGRDALALEIERLQETVAEAERLLRNSVHYTWAYGPDYLRDEIEAFLTRSTP